MRRVIILCILSASLGGLMAIKWHNPSVTDTQSLAQEPVPGVTVAAQPPANAAPGAAVAPAILDALTPEERVNVLVYQNVNRSVVNINTRGRSGDRFLLFEIVSEGEGSGTVIDRAGHVLTNFHVVEGARKFTSPCSTARPTMPGSSAATRTRT